MRRFSPSWLEDYEFPGAQRGILDILVPVGIFSSMTHSFEVEAFEKADLQRPGTTWVRLLVDVLQNDPQKQLHHFVR